MVVLGDPVCPIENSHQLSTAFYEHCKKQGKDIIYLSISPKFNAWAIKNLHVASVEFGQEYFLDPFDDPRKGSGGSLARRKFRHATSEGVSVHEYVEKSENIEQAIERVGTDWLKHRKGPQIHISNVHLFSDCFGKRWFYAKHRGRIVGVVVLNRMRAKKGWLLNHVMITKEAPHGTQEMLVINAIEALQNEGVHFVSFGNVPTGKLGKIVGLGKFSSWIASNGFGLISHLFHLNGHMKFWEKFQPKSEPSFILFSRGKIGLKEVLSLRRALNVTL